MATRTGVPFLDRTLLIFRILPSENGSNRVLLILKHSHFGITYHNIMMIAPQTALVGGFNPSEKY